MKTSLIIATAAIGVGLLAGCANLERSRDLGNPEVAGHVLAQQACSLCHGARGVSESPNVPILAAQQPAYLTAQLTAFRGHSRQDPQGFEYMWGVTRKLTDKQIEDIAAYYAAQSPASRRPQGDAPAIEAGRRLFVDGAPDRDIPACSGCHGDRGQGLAAFPRVAGQHADYVAKQLLVFQRTDERPEGAIMKTVAHKLTAADIANAAAFLQSL
jgi:cytochrome c553